MQLKQQESSIYMRNERGSQQSIGEPASKLATGLLHKLQTEFSSPSADFDEEGATRRVPYPVRPEEIVETSAQSYGVYDKQIQDEDINYIQRSQIDEEELQKHRVILDAALRKEGSVRQMGRTANEFQSFKQKRANESANSPAQSENYENKFIDNSKQMALNQSLEKRLYDRHCSNDRCNSSTMLGMKKKASSAIGNQKREDQMNSHSSRVALVNNAYEQKLSNYFQNPGKKPSLRNIPTISGELRRGKRIKRPKMPKDLIYPPQGMPSINGGTNDMASQKDLGQPLHQWYRDHQLANVDEASDATKNSRVITMNIYKNSDNSPRVAFYDGQQQQNFFPSMPNGDDSSRPLPQIRNPQINLHQHFNQPNITNFNQQAFYLEQKNGTQHATPNMAIASRSDLKGRSNMTTTGEYPQQSEAGRTFQGKFSGKPRGGWIAAEKESIMSDHASNVTYPKSNRRRKLVSLTKSPRGVIQINEQALEDDQSSAAKGGKDESLEKAIKMQYKFFANRQTQRQLFPNISHLPSSLRRYRDYYQRLQNQRNNLVDIQPLNKHGLSRHMSSQQYLIQCYGSRQQNYAHNSQKSLAKRYSMYRERSLATMDKEDLYEQLLMSKKELNMLQRVNRRLRTRHHVMEDQVKAKDKLLDEILRTTDATTAKGLLDKAEKETEGSKRDQKGSSPSLKKTISKHRMSHDRLRADTDRANANNLQMTIFTLKKEVSDLKEQLTYKIYENEDMRRSLKSMKVHLLQEEVRVYQRECFKLRSINEQVIQMAQNSGLEQQLQSNKQIKQFMALNLSQSDQDGSLDSPPDKQSTKRGQTLQLESLRRSRRSLASSKDSNPAGSKAESQRHLPSDLVAQGSKLENIHGAKETEKDRRHERLLLNELDRLKFEREQLLEMDTKKNKVIERLEMRIKQLETQRKNANNARKMGRESPLQAIQPVGLRSRDSNTNSKKSLPQITNRHGQHAGTDKSQTLQSQREPKTPIKTHPSGSLSLRASVDDHKLMQELQKDHEQIKKKLAKQEQQNRQMKNEIEKLKQRRDHESQTTPRKDIQSMKSTETIKSTIQQQSARDSRSKATSEAGDKADKKERDERTKQIRDLRQQADRREQRIRALEKQVEEMKAQSNVKGGPPDAQGAAKEDAKKKGSAPPRHATEYASSKKMPPSSKNESEGGETARMDSGLKQEIKDLEHRLENARMSDVDDRSEFGFSQVNSVVQGCNDAQLSPRNPDQREPFKSPYMMMANNTIKEDQNEDLENSNINLEVYKRVSRDRQIEIQKEKVKGDTGVLSVDDFEKSRSQSEVHKLSPRKLTVAPSRDNNILHQLDAIPNESKYSYLDTETVQNQSEFASQVPKVQMKFIEVEDPSVQLGLERLGRLLQLRCVPLAQVDQVVLQDKFKPQQSIKISQLQPILENLLGMDKGQSLDFARFLIEERDEDDKRQTTIEFDPNRKVNSQYIPIRLQTRFKKYPAVFTEKQEKAVIEKMNQQVSRRDQKAFAQKLNEQEEAIISLQHFEKQLKTIKSLKLSDAEIECAFIFLSRGGHLSELDKDEKRKNLLSAPHLKEKVKGFDSQDIVLLFPHTKTMSSVYDEEIESEKYTEPDKDESIKGDEVIDEPVDDDEMYSEIVDDDADKAGKHSDDGIDDDVHYTEPIDDEAMGDGEMIDEEVEDEIDQDIIRSQSEIRSIDVDVPSQGQQKGSMSKPVVGKTDLGKQKASSSVPASGASAAKPNGSQPANDDVRAVLESIKKENERVKLMEESKMRSSKEQSENNKESSKGAGAQEEAGAQKKESTLPSKEHQEEQKVNNDIKGSTGSRKMTENSKKDGQVMNTTRSDIDFDQQDSMSASQVNNLKKSRPESQSQKSPLNSIKEENEDNQKSAEVTQNSVKAANNKRYDLPMEEEQVEQDEERVAADEDDGRAAKGAEEAGKGAEVKPDEKKQAAPAEQREQPAEPPVDAPPAAAAEQEGDYEYYDEEDYGDEEEQDEAGAQDAGIIQVDDQQEAKKEQENAKQEAADQKKEEEKPAAKPNADNGADDSDANQIKEKAPEKVKPSEVPKDLLIALAKVYQKNSGVPAEQISVQSSMFLESGRIVLDYAEVITRQYPELMDSCRDLFREVIYSTYDEQKLQDEAFVKDGGNKKGEEIEVLLPEDLLYKFENQINYSLSQKQKEYLDTIFRVKRMHNTYLYHDLRDVFSVLGIRDYKTPKGTQSTAHLNYEKLDLRSIRLINRMIHYLGSQQIAFSAYMQDLIQKQEVKTQTSEQEIEIFMARAFFEKLHQSGIKKSPAPYPNLCFFLCIDRKYKKFLMLKKLKRCIIDFNQSAYFQSIGLKKMKFVPHQHQHTLVRRMTIAAHDVKAAMEAPKYASLHKEEEQEAEDGDYEYYDEEDDPNEDETQQEVGVDRTTAPPQLDKNSTPNTAQDRKEAANKEAEAPPLDEAAGQGDYEYYDEEDDYGPEEEEDQAQKPEQKASAKR